MNIIQVAGHLGADAETRFTPSGQKVVSFNIATNIKKNGADVTMWWRITIWGDKFDKMVPYLKKGSSVIVIGELSKPEIWTNKEGQPQVNLEIRAEIVRFSPFGKGEKQGQEGGQQAQPAYAAAYGTPPASSYSEENYGGSFAGNSGQGQQRHGQGQGYGQEESSDDDLPF